MNSSISHSESQVPKLALKLLIVAVVTWAACAIYTVWLNPEVRFYRELAAVQDGWSQRMDREHGRKVVVFGGSSCMFSIIGEQMLAEYGLPTVNRGLTAGMAVKIPTLNAIKDLKAGDTLIVALEPGHLTEPIELTSLAVQFSYSSRTPGWSTRYALGLPGERTLSTLLALRPSNRHVLTLLGKMILKRDLYRYKISDAMASGWMSTDVRVPFDGPPGHGQQLSDDAKRYLSMLSGWCAERGIRVAYSLPRGFAPPEAATKFKADNAKLLVQIAAFIPVLKDPSLGCDSDRGHFADTAWHLNKEGSELRTANLGKAVKEWSLWSAGELQLAVSGGQQN